MQLLTTSPPEPKPINLDGIDLTNLQFLSHVLMKAQSVNQGESESVINRKGISIGTLLLYVILLIVILFYCIKLVYRIRDFRRNHQNGSPDNLETAMGEVMHSDNRPGFVTIRA